MSDTDRAAFEGIQSATILRPGDRVLVVVHHVLSRKQADNMTDRLAAEFPDIHFAFVSGVEDVLVQPAEGSTE